MFVEKIKTQRTKKNGMPSQQFSVLYRFKCDTCGKIYDKKPGNVSVSKSGLHFCRNACKFQAHKPGKNLRLISEATSIDRYGTPNPMQSDVMKEQHKRAFQEKHGENVTCALQVTGAKEKRRRTHLERYGVEETFQAEGPKAKRRITWMKRYGVPYKPIFFSKEQLQEAMRKMPQKWSSKGEELMCEILHKHFGEVVRQKWVNGWPIDAYVPSIDTYVQFDGVYWHGLDRDIEIIKASIKPRDKAIYQKWLTDRKQCEWFKEHNLKLIRITDIEFKNIESCSGVPNLDFLGKEQEHQEV